jgi:threonine/homoserine/homoserine lactone efflux protein
LVKLFTRNYYSIKVLKTSQGDDSIMDNLFWQGLVLGFSIAAPVGPIGILCIQRTLNKGQLYGLVSGLGAATADAVYGSMAAFGLTAVTGCLMTQAEWLRLGGSIFLCYLGVKIFLTRAADFSQTAPTGGKLSAYTSTFLLTLANPMTILAFVAIFAGLGLVETTPGYASGGLLVLGVFTGSALWWLLLSSGANFFRPKLDARRLTWINKGAGVTIIGFGLLILIEGIL